MKWVDLPHPDLNIHLLSLQLGLEAIYLLPEVFSVLFVLTLCQEILCTLDSSLGAIS